VLQGFDGARSQRDAEGFRSFDDPLCDLARGSVGAVLRGATGMVPGSVTRGATLSPTCP
jgi:hypothetical protein